MTAPRVVVCDSWADFKAAKLAELYHGGPIDRQRYYFRGHGSAEWPLMSSFDRWFQSQRKQRSQKQKIAERLLDLFQDEAQRSEDFTEWKDSEQRLALAQHHGVPTRLLDWTESPYIAAFFAFSGIVESPAAGRSVAVWCLDRQSPIWSAENGVELLSIASPYNLRLRNQLGKFTYLRAAYDTLEDHIAHFEGEADALIRFDIPSADAKVALADLDVMGINYSTVYPGLAGAGAAAKLRMTLEG